MKKIFSANFLFCIAFTCFAQIKISPVQTHRVQNQNIQNVNVPKKQVAFRLSPYSLSSLPANANTVLNLTVKEFDSVMIQGEQFCSSGNWCIPF